MFRLINVQAGRTANRLPRPSLPGAGSLRNSLRGGRFSGLRFSRQDREAASAAGRPVLAFAKKHHQGLLFLLWLFLGSVIYTVLPGEFYSEDIARTVTDGFYEAITVGYSVGLSPRDPAYIPNPWFSSAYILCGASLIAVILTGLGQKVEDGSSKRLFDDLKRREEYEAKMSVGSHLAHAKAFCAYNTGYVMTIALWVLFLIFIIVWSIVATSHNDPIPGHIWGFADAQYFAISLCSSAGSFSLPYESPLWAYGMAAISMAIGVPLMALAISSIVVMCLQETKYNKIRRAASTPVSTTELETLRRVGLGSGEEVSKEDFVLLGVLRLGTEAGLIAYLCDAYDSAEDEYGRHIRSVKAASIENGDTMRRKTDETLDAPDVDEYETAPSNSVSSSIAKGSATAGSRPRLSSQELSSAMLSFRGLGLSSSVVSTASTERRPKLGREWSVRASMNEQTARNLMSCVMEVKDDADLSRAEEGDMDPPIPEEEPGNDSENDAQFDEAEEASDPELGDVGEEDRAVHNDNP
ncbi:hypothetical protein ACHAXT_004247 [Thalassiosira profunda]